ncbi:MAG: hypothetical protein AB7L09_01545 [Nitrospira sp.]
MTLRSPSELSAELRRCAGRWLSQRGTTFLDELEDGTRRDAGSSARLYGPVVSIYMSRSPDYRGSELFVSISTPDVFITVNRDMEDSAEWSDAELTAVRTAVETFAREMVLDDLGSV